MDHPENVSNVDYSCTKYFVTEKCPLEQRIKTTCYRRGTLKRTTSKATIGVGKPARRLTGKRFREDIVLGTLENGPF